MTIEQTLEQYPTLSDFGFRADSTAAYAEREILRESPRVQSICEWLSQFKKTKTANLSSYYLKHVAEDEIGYSTNGEFILAAIISGFVVHPFPGSPNAGIGISRREIASYANRARDMQAA